MAESATGFNRSIKVSGTYNDFEDPPEILPVSVAERTTSRSFDGDTLLQLVLELDWATIGQAAAGSFAGKALHTFAQWLYRRFRANPTQDQDQNPTTTIEITSGDTTKVLVVTSPEDLAEKLKEFLG